MDLWTRVSKGTLIVLIHIFNISYSFINVLTLYNTFFFHLKNMTYDYSQEETHNFNANLKSCLTLR